MLNYQTLIKELNQTSLVIVSKKRSITEIQYYYNQGHRHFGENKAQELLTKVDHFPDIQWHFIGHLQTNKVKAIIPYVYSIDSIDSLHLLAKVDEQSKRCNKITNCLIQLNLAQEATKHGLLSHQIEDFMKAIPNYKHVKVNGFMCIGPHCDDPKAIVNIFKQAQAIFQKYADQYQLTTLSMGMSNDYKLALLHGTTEVRLGSILF
ncbi:MAG: YggS family pyridoxal phosphate-dependent enzyme [Erysipelotrichaceae bacterium]|nr:YggS family pyridoxal phosphate-dependent enzyme [Erysipelotrichaceae bacterium]MDY5252026.1 YggS family pyridoxal phosphate-dependent enzyme [Erysipelotrichaceae bacterium]